VVFFGRASMVVVLAVVFFGASMVVVLAVVFFGASMVVAGGVVDVGTVAATHPRMHAANPAPNNRSWILQLNIDARADTRCAIVPAL